MSNWTRLELHQKFWEIRAEGAQVYTRFGKVGTEGQTRLKQAADPKAEMAAMIAAKEKEGFVATNGKKPKAAAKTATKTAAKPAGPAALGLFKDFGLCGVWRDGADVWFCEVDDDDEQNAKLKVGASIADVASSDDGSTIERWHFGSPKEAERAAAWVLAHAGKKAKISGDSAAPIAAWTKRAKVARPRIPRLEPSAKGPVKLAVDTAHDWIYPRPPSTGFVHKRMLVPVWSLVGPIDPRFGKRVGIYASACPTGDDQVFEIVVQNPAKPSAVDAYFATWEGMHSVHLSMQVMWDSQPHWCVTEHICEKGAPGHYTTEHVGKRDKAEKLFAERIAAVSGERMKAPLPWYRGILAEIDHHHRPGKRKPQTVSLAPAYGPYVEHMADSYTQPSRMLEARGNVGFIGGTPRFCQEQASFVPKNPCGKAEVIHLLTLGRGDLGASDLINDGDMGAVTFYAAPGDPFGTVEFSCH